MVCTRKFLIILLFPLITGCTAVATTVPFFGFGFSYNYLNAASRTFSYSFERVGDATIKALRKMDIKIVEDILIKENRKIEAVTDKLKIEIWLERITSKATRINVNARKKLIMKDKATSSEIISQVDKALVGED